jgi:threonine dehydratase
MMCLMVTGGAWVKAVPTRRLLQVRGATNAIAALALEVRGKGDRVSVGNHAIAVATASKIFGIKATIVMPADAPKIKPTRRAAWARRW